MYSCHRGKILLPNQSPGVSYAVLSLRPAPGSHLGSCSSVRCSLRLPCPQPVTHPSPCASFLKVDNGCPSSLENPSAAAPTPSEASSASQTEALLHVFPSPPPHTTAGQPSSPGMCSFWTFHIKRITPYHVQCRCSSVERGARLEEDLQVALGPRGRGPGTQGEGCLRSGGTSTGREFSLPPALRTP